MMKFRDVIQSNPMAALNQLLCGIAGDKTLAIILYIVMSSCRLAKGTLSALIAACSSSGKSFQANYVANLFPEEWIVQTSKISAAVLPKFPTDYFKNKIVILDETAGKNEEVSYILRLLQSEEKFKYWVTTPTRTSDEQTIMGPITLIETTTDDVDKHREDNLNRVLILEPDQSINQTNHILAVQAESAANLNGFGPPQLLVEAHKEFQRSLTAYPVIIPYAQHMIPRCRHINMRRDFPKILSLVSTVCHLRQLVKPIQTSDDGTEFLTADITDYETAFPLIEHAFKLTLDKSDTLKDYHQLLKSGLERSAKETFTRLDFERLTGYGSTKSKLVIRDLLEFGFINVVREWKSNRPGVYSISRDVPSTNENLITPEELAGVWGQI